MYQGVQQHTNTNIETSQIEVINHVFPFGFRFMLSETRDTRDLILMTHSFENQSFLWFPLYGKPTRDLIIKRTE